jgi:hypothetical protein
MKVTSVAFVPKHWAQFQKLAASQGVTAGSLLRQLIVRELRRAKKEDGFGTE